MLFCNQFNAVSNIQCRFMNSMLSSIVPAIQSRFDDCFQRVYSAIVFSESIQLVYLSVTKINTNLINVSGPINTYN